MVERNLASQDIYGNTGIWRPRRDSVFGALPADIQAEAWHRITTLSRWGLLRELADSSEELLDKVLADVISTAMNRQGWLVERAEKKAARHIPREGELVYYLRFGERVKIGTTTNLAQRMQSVPHDELLMTEPGGYDVEARRHAQFQRWRIKGEWFHYNDVMKRHIVELLLAA